jgi:preprotein translocase subunit SecG
MFTATLVLIVILAIFLILIVFIQNSKGGLNQSMGTSSNQLIGVKKTTDVLEKITWGLAVSIMVLCLITNFVVDRPSTSGEGEEISTINMEKAQESQSASPKQANPSKDTSNK